MGINFEFATATRIVFGNGSFEKVPGMVAELGSKVMLVTGKNTTTAEKLANRLTEINIPTIIFNILAEPSTADIEHGTELARQTGCNVVVGLGGGSVIDSAKAIAALAPNKGEIADYLEVIGKGKSLINIPLPCIAIPTTAGTGAEVTKNSVIKSIENNVKVSLRSDLMYPRIAVADPLLTLSMPPALTASAGIDALTHLLETFVSLHPNPFIDMLCRQGMKLISQSVLQAFSDGNNLEAREKMAMASMLGGMALANVKLGAVHGFAGPMGGMYPIPHGAVCACLLPAVMEANIAALKAENRHLQLDRFAELAQILTGNINAGAEDGTVWVKELVSKLQIPSLTDFGITEADFPELVEKARNSSSMKGNPIELNHDQLLTILQKSI